MVAHVNACVRTPAAQPCGRGARDLRGGLRTSSIQGRTTYNQNAMGAWADNSEICTWCPACGGCSHSAVVHTGLFALHHELVHAVVSRAWGTSDTLFTEGIALGLDRNLGTYGSGITTIYSALSNEKPSEIAGSGRHGGGHFSRWLVERFGPAKFRETFDRLNRTSTKEQVFAAVEEVYGLCDGLLNIPRNGDRWELRVDSDCDSPHMFGPSDDGRMFVAATIDIPPELKDQPLATWIPSNTQAVVWPCIEEPLYDADIELPVEHTGEVYMRLCPDNGKFPGAYPLDKSVDPENCLGD